MKRLRQLIELFRQRGVGYSWHLIHGYLLPRIAHQLFFEWPRSSLRRVTVLSLIILVSLFTFVLYLIADALGAILVLLLVLPLFLLSRWVWAYWTLVRMQNEARYLREAAESRHVDESFTRWEKLQVPLETRMAVNRALHASAEQELVIGKIDNDGRILGQYGKIDGPANIENSDEFVPRHRFLLDVVLVDGKVLLRKNFSGDRIRFYQEWRNLSLLAGHANVPAVHHVDENNTCLYKNYIPGRTIRDVLVDAGAHILGGQTNGDPGLVGLSSTERLHAILARGTIVLKRCFSESFFQKMESQLETIHRAGIVRLSLTFGNIIVDDEENAWFIDFEGAQRFRNVKSFFFRLRRDEDRRKFNRIYDRNLITEASARAELAELRTKSEGWYAPIDFGNGLAIGGFWSIQSGSGRWEYLNREVMTPLIAGKRVLDLGTNNAVMPLMMLRAGAREVVGVEISNDLVAAARMVHRIFEWRDMRAYDLELIQANMIEIERNCWEEFDVVTALCTLYYLSEEEMGRVVRRASELAPMMIVQANAETRENAVERKRQKSSVAFLKRTLEENGFPKVEVIAPPDFSRPILMGWRKCDPVS
jgi:hypothetical protein